MRSYSSEKEIFAAFSDRALQRGGESFFNKEAALAFLAECARNEFAVLGTEGFRVSVDETIPDPNWIADYSAAWTSHKRRVLETTELAREFVLSAPNGILFSFVIDRQNRDE